MKLYYSKNLNPRVAMAVAQYLQSPVEFEFAMPMHPDHREAFRPSTRTRGYQRWLAPHGNEQLTFTVNTNNRLGGPYLVRLRRSDGTIVE